ncbi:hypothetical protein J437_LFUL007132 [Ladona fulva]|uniref:Reverse transcriptase RNase H-like domain-containing protein n=1 Tax=Ladona fulva TaxID=123851 RepID=A0A8K0P357_LADFU|nr:hypothetical protein J437_LFUL007132 [Ladona fulva]
MEQAMGVYCGLYQPRLSEHDIQYHSNELECLVIILAVEKFHRYIYGAPFTVATDNSAGKANVAADELSQNSTARVERTEGLKQRTVCEC